ncbi:MAG: hypothetical protein ACYC1D_07115, partial [Acidimicrobiales bacterium]
LSTPSPGPPPLATTADASHPPIITEVLRYDISYDPDRHRWYLDASWKTHTAPQGQGAGVAGPSRAWLRASSRPVSVTGSSR